MLLIVGLGNPGDKYWLNRHNVGFMAIDRIAADHTDGKWKKQFQGFAIAGSANGEKFLLLKPQTYMNDSGRSVGEACRYHKLDPAQITVFHDEIDLQPAKVKVKSGGGHAGHNGLRSVSQHVGAGFTRVRLGVGHPGDKTLVQNYVLGNFGRAERQGWLSDLLDGISDGFQYLLAHDQAGFLNKVNTCLRPNPNRPATKVPEMSVNVSPTVPETKRPESVFAKLGKLFGN